MPEAAESQYKICKLHFEQMSKPDRDSNQALRAERECKQVVLQFPNSKFIPDTEQLLREIDEVMAEGEMRSANFYFQKGSRAAAANRFMGLVDQYPLYSRADEALWKGADAYLGMGPRLRGRAGQALQKIVREYPLGLYAEMAKKKLRELELEVPEADPAAVARMKYEQENRTKQSAFRSATAFLRPGPDVTTAAKTGSPAMNAPKQTVPANVPEPVVSGAAGFQGDVTVSPVANGAGATPATGATASVDGAKPQGDAAPAAATQAAADKASADAASTATAKDKKKKDKKDKKNQKQTQAPDPNASANQSPAPSPDQTPKP
jgi:outer membrane protein assembly factor BamD